MNRLRNISLALAFVLLSFTVADASVSFSVGTGDYYLPVGDHDYLPYAYQANPGYVAPRVSFYQMMSGYGNWVTIPTFGQAWQPYAAAGWRPYTHGHWQYNSQYGPMWQGYEPWAWAGYHYGNWIFSQQFGWVWIPGYEWHPGRVAWASSYDSIGWMPLPPSGYDYSRGNLSYIGPHNQFAYRDDDFTIGFGIGTGDFSYGGPYYDPRYRNLYYNPSYLGINSNLWTFIDSGHFGSDNYADYYLGPDYTRYVFDRRLVRITNQRLDRTALQTITRQQIQETPVEVRQLQTDRQTIRVVVPKGEKALEEVRRNSKRVVEEVIAPGFAEKQKTFKGQNSKNKDAVAKVFRQENVQPKVQTLSSDEVISRGRQAKQAREQTRTQRVEVAKEKVAKIEREGKVKEPKKQKSTSQELRPGRPESPGRSEEFRTQQQKEQPGAHPSVKKETQPEETGKYTRPSQPEQEQQGKEKARITESPEKTDESTTDESTVEQAEEEAGKESEKKASDTKKKSKGKDVEKAKRKSKDKEKQKETDEDPS